MTIYNYYYYKGGPNRVGIKEFHRILFLSQEFCFLKLDWANYNLNESLPALFRKNGMVDVYYPDNSIETA